MRPFPGFMDAMTMPYKLKDPSILSELHPGDVITADLLVSQDADARRAAGSHRGGGAGQAGLRPTVMYHVPAAGDAVPDFKLRNQDGRDRFILSSFAARRC